MKMWYIIFIVELVGLLRTQWLPIYSDTCIMKRKNDNVIDEEI